MRLHFVQNMAVHQVLRIESCSSVYKVYKVYGGVYFSKYVCVCRAGVTLVSGTLFLGCDSSAGFDADGGSTNFNSNAMPTTCLHILFCSHVQFESIHLSWSISSLYTLYVNSIISDKFIQRIGYQIRWQYKAFVSFFTRWNVYYWLSVSVCFEYVAQIPYLGPFDNELFSQLVFLVAVS